MTIDTSIDALTAQTSELLAVCVSLKNNTETRIAAAVLVSTNAALLPMMQMTTNSITTNTLLITLIAKG